MKIAVMAVTCSDEVQIMTNVQQFKSLLYGGGKWSSNDESRDPHTDQICSERGKNRRTPGWLQAAQIGRLQSCVATPLTLAG